MFALSWMDLSAYTRESMQFVTLYVVPKAPRPSVLRVSYSVR